MESKTEFTVYVTDPNNASRDKVKLIPEENGSYIAGSAVSVGEQVPHTSARHTFLIQSVGGRCSGNLSFTLRERDDDRFSVTVLNNTFPLEVSVYMSTEIQTAADLGEKAALLEVRGGDVSLSINLIGTILPFPTTQVTSYYDSDGYAEGVYWRPQKSNPWTDLLQVVAFWVVIGPLLIITLPITLPIAALWYFILNPLFKILRWLWKY